MRYLLYLLLISEIRGGSKFSKKYVSYLFSFKIYGLVKPMKHFKLSNCSAFKKYTNETAKNSGKGKITQIGKMCNVKSEYYTKF